MIAVGNKLRKAVLLTLSCSTLMAALSVQAQEAQSDFKLSGFLSIVGGKVTQGSFDTNYSGPTQINGSTCPCYLADWGNAGIYTKSFSLKPESRVGVQLTYKPNTSTSFVGQLVSRGTDGTPNLQWAYGGYKLNANWEVQVGRKRIPLYYYSDFQDIGLSYPWIATPPELYGWEVTNYNGASMRYNGALGEFNLNASLFVGAETAKDPLYQKLFYSQKSEVSWKNLRGGDIELSRDALTLRAVFLQANVRSQVFDLDIDDPAKLQAYGLAANLDFDDWFVLSELTQLSREFTQAHYKVTAPAMTIGVGKRLGAWTGFLNYARYTEKSSDEDIYKPQKYARTSFTVRYDLDSTSAVKAQIDRNKDSSNNFGGNATVLRLSYDRVF